MDRLMNFKETMHYLNISKAALYRWATEGTIPAIRMGRRWRFKKERLDKWLDDKENTKKKKRK